MALVVGRHRHHAGRNRHVGRARRASSRRYASRCPRRRGPLLVRRCAWFGPSACLGRRPEPAGTELRGLSHCGSESTSSVRQASTASEVLPGSGLRLRGSAASTRIPALRADRESPGCARCGSQRSATGGIIWVVISGALLLVLALLENLSLLALSGLLLTCLLNPVFTYSAATVNNDAAGIAAGAVALIAWSWSRRRPGWSLPLGIAAGVLVGLTKGQYIAVPLALVIAAIVEEGRGLRSWSGITGASRRHLCAVVMFTAAVVAFGGFSLVQGVRATVPSSRCSTLSWGSHRSRHSSRAP